MIYPIISITASDIVRATGGELAHGSSDAIISSISCDSRTVTGDALFVPLKGERFDGHSFIADVCQRGIGGYIFSGDAPLCNAPFAIRVADTSQALIDIAAYYRTLFDIPVVGLTGSVGKTTTKELVASVLSRKYNTHCTKGNFNNNVGVPLTLFGLSKEHEAAVIEMGMSNFGEIEVLSICSAPDIAIITNIGTSHIEFLGSQEGILKAKSEIFKGLAPHGKVILNGDDPYLLTLKDKLDGREVRYVGINNPDCDYVATDISSDESGCSFKVNSKSYTINLAGVHNVYNALLAIAAGEMLDLDHGAIADGLALYHSDGIRQNIISVNGYKLINDCYNSSPQSAIAALSVLRDVKAERRIAVLGDIAELGDKAELLHRSVGKAVCDSSVDVLVTVGKLSAYIADEAANKEIHSFDSAPEAGRFIKGFVTKGDAILVKGSRCMKMEQISEMLI